MSTFEETGTGRARVGDADWPYDPWLATWLAADVGCTSHGPPWLWMQRRSMRLQRLVEDAARGSAWWRGRLGDALAAARRETTAFGAGPWDVVPGAAATPGVPAWLQRVPPLRRDELMRHFDDAVTDPAVRLADARRFAQAARGTAAPFLGRYAVWESSGSTGEPALFVHDGLSLAVSDAVQALRGPSSSLGAALAGRRVAFVGALDGAFAAVSWLQRLCALHPWIAATTRAVSFMQPLDTVVAELRAWRPTVLATYPSMAWVLAQAQRQGRLDLRLQAVWTGGEMLEPALRRAIAGAFDCEVRDSYGASECLDIASDCALGALHLHADWVVLEPVDAAGRPVPPGEAGETTLLTHLGNRVLPLLRLDIGDRVRLSPVRCRCGSPLPVLTVEGRRDDLLTMAAADGGEVHLSPLGITTAIEEGAGVFDFRVVQADRHRLWLEVPGHDGPAHGGAGSAAAAARALREHLRAQGVADPQVRCRGGEAAAGGGKRSRAGKRRRVVAAAAPAGADARPRGRPA